MERNRAALQIAAIRHFACWLPGKNAWRPASAIALPPGRSAWYTALSRELAKGGDQVWLETQCVA